MASKSETVIKVSIATEIGVVDIAGELTDIIAHAAFFQSLPTLCPVDGTKTKFQYRKVGEKDYEYFELVSTGYPTYKLPLHQFNDNTGRMYIKEGWYKFDPKTEKDVLVWERGKPVSGKVPKSESLDTSNPPTFGSPEDAITWSIKMGAFSSKEDAIEAYASLKKQLTQSTKTITASLFYSKWIEHVNTILEGGGT